MEKYYRPDINEFYQGFEFQYQDISTAQWVKGVYWVGWESEDMSISGWLDPAYNFGVRCKYLDREDIESLGFKKDEGPHRPIYYSEGEITERDLYIKDDLYLTFWDTMPIVGIFRDNQYLFQGEIRNKSELKVILRQIGL